MDHTNPTVQKWSAEATSDIVISNIRMASCLTTDNSLVTVHGALLVYYVPYFATALSSEPEHINFDLTSVQAKTFISWLYTGHIIVPDDHQIKADTSYKHANGSYPRKNADAEDAHIFTLYLFAGKTNAIAFSRAIMTHIVFHSPHRSVPSLQNVNRVFDKLPESSGLIRWLIDRYAYHGDELNEEQIKDLEAHPTFHDLVRSRKNKIGRRVCRSSHVPLHLWPCCAFHGDADRDLGCRCRHQYNHAGCPCNYHEHNNAEEWLECGRDHQDPEFRTSDMKFGKEEQHRHMIRPWYFKGTSVSDVPADLPLLLGRRRT